MSAGPAIPSGITRRTLLGSSAAATLVPMRAAAAAAASGAPSLDRGDFAFQGNFLNAAYTHPMPRRVGDQIAAFRQDRLTHADRMWTGDNFRDAAAEQFAGLVHVRPQDLAIVPSTTTGENMLLDALGIGPDAGVVTDALHYFGSLALYRTISHVAKAMTMPIMPSAWKAVCQVEAAAMAGPPARPAIWPT